MTGGGCERYLTDLQNFLEFATSLNDRDRGGAIKTNAYDDKVHGRGWDLDESERKNMMKKALWDLVTTGNESKVRTDVSTVDDIHHRRLNFIDSLDELLQAELSVVIWLCPRIPKDHTRRGLGIKIRASLDEETGVGGLSEVPDFGMRFTSYAYSLGRQGPRVLSSFERKRGRKIRQNAVPHLALLVLRDDAPLISFQFPPDSPFWCSNL
ncbi:uncharacterized protein P174DRAFT_434690 [Aspergillus novofumigatus IBT 16806]|uniref:Uncharacterized protein n=1 Tax=Aspergillus novofumigatus (strain IBT 16806) TaxID=1392255 RepID=A0A2I1BY78_ASPN1|nr:uncharacterized protein P174DRAFT_434690 [Aspergillus novofumigatus IBT 16806]PKX90301.1 hypothetical protein P174DRAFT_434690 [Aspergillus novofumigatus IBT 16806]